MLKVKTVRVESNRDASVRHRGEVLVFVPASTRPGPFGDETGTLADEFIWRRTNSAPYRNEEIGEAIAGVLAEKNIEPVKIKYDHKAGCGMCPCSPGYIVYTKEVHPFRRISIWLEAA